MCVFNVRYENDVLNVCTILQMSFCCCCCCCCCCSCLIQTIISFDCLYFSKLHHFNMCLEFNLSLMSFHELIVLYVTFRMISSFRSRSTFVFNRNLMRSSSVYFFRVVIVWELLSLWTGMKIRSRLHSTCACIYTCLFIV